MQQTPHETEAAPRKPIIGIGPNMQARADRVGGRMVAVLEKQAAALTLSLKLYRMYRAECKQRELRPKKLDVDVLLQPRLPSATSEGKKKIDVTG